MRARKLPVTETPSGRGYAHAQRAAPARQAEGVAQAVATLKEAARTRAVPRERVFAALQALERAGPAERDWEATVTTPSPSGAARRPRAPGRKADAPNTDARAQRGRGRPARLAHGVHAERGGQPLAGAAAARRARAGAAARLLLPGHLRQRVCAGRPRVRHVCAQRALGIPAAQRCAPPACGLYTPQPSPWRPPAPTSGRRAGPYTFRENVMEFKVTALRVGLFPFKFALPLSIGGPSKDRSNGAPARPGAPGCGPMQPPPGCAPRHASRQASGTCLRTATSWWRAARAAASRCWRARRRRGCWSTALPSWAVHANGAWGACCCSGERGGETQGESHECSTPYMYRLAASRVLRASAGKVTTALPPPALLDAAYMQPIGTPKTAYGAPDAVQKPGSPRRPYAGSSAVRAGQAYGAPAQCLPSCPSNCSALPDTCGNAPARNLRPRACPWGAQRCGRSTTPHAQNNN